MTNYGLKARVRLYILGLPKLYSPIRGGCYDHIERHIVDFSVNYFSNLALMTVRGFNVMQLRGFASSKNTFLLDTLRLEIAKLTVGEPKVEHLF